MNVTSTNLETIEKITLRPMSVNEFLVELRLLSLAFDWKMSVAGAIRGEFDGLIYCPITAMVMCKTGQVFRMDQWGCGGKILGMQPDDALLVAEAADFPYGHNTELVSLYEQMRESLGLSKHRKVETRHEPI